VAAKAAGMVGKSAHGMRMAAAGPGVMASFYAKSANRSKLAAKAIGKLDRAKTQNRTFIYSAPDHNGLSRLKSISES
jgi:hypothetical protein